MINIKEQYPRAYELIKEQVLKELNKSGKLSPEIMAAVPVDSIVQNSIGASVRLLYEVLDKEKVYMYTVANSIDGKDLENSKIWWTYHMAGSSGTAQGYSTRKEAEIAGFTAALELLNSKK
jgi:hypothetical protein